MKKYLQMHKMMMKKKKKKKNGVKLTPLPVRSRRRSRDPPTPAVSLPQNEANEEYGWESEEVIICCDPNSENGDTDVEIVPDSFDDKHVPDSGTDLESLNLDACIMCGIQDELVWHCGGFDCPVAFHDKCVNGGPNNEYNTYVYCPYCWYKIQVENTYALREEALEAEKALFEYLDRDMNGGREDGESVPKVKEETSLSDGENWNQEHYEGCVDITSDEHLHLEKDVCPLGEGKVQTPKDKDRARGDCVQSNEDVNQSVVQNGELKDDTNRSRDESKQLGKGVNQSGDRVLQLEEVNDQSIDQGVQLEEGISQSGDQHVELEKDQQNEVYMAERDVNQSGDQVLQLEEVNDRSIDQGVQLEKEINQPGDQHVELEKDQQNEVYMAERDVSDYEKATEGQTQVEMNEEKTNDGFEASESEERSKTEKFLDAEDGKDEETAEAQPKSDARTDKVVDGSPFLSVQESFSGREYDEAQSNMKRKRQKKLNAFDNAISSNESSNEENGQDGTEQSNGSFKSSSSRQATSPIGKTKNQKRKATKGKLEKLKRETSSVKNDKRKRLRWTPEEEAMLKVGVETFSGDVNRNTPWRKILEMGVHVFHDTRTPTDLKDKWRTMNHV